MVRRRFCSGPSTARDGWHHPFATATDCQSRFRHCATVDVAPGIVYLITDLFGGAENVAGVQPINCPGDPQVVTNTIITTLINLVNWFSWFVAIVSVVMGLYAGFLYITARDNPERSRQAALTLSYVIIGIAVAVIAFSIIRVVETFMG